jgi:hypothetical protein
MGILVKRTELSKGSGERRFLAWDDPGVQVADRAQQGSQR